MTGTPNSSYDAESALTSSGFDTESQPILKNILSQQWHPSKNRDGNHSHLVLTSITNLFRTMVGSGLLVLPYAFLDGGAGLGAVNLAVMGSLSLLGFLAIGRACHATGARTYREAWHRTVGKYETAVDVAIYLECSIVMVSFMILLIDYLDVILQAVLGLSGIFPRETLAMVMTLPVLLPLGLQPRLQNLRFSSWIGNIAVSYTTLYVILECILSERQSLGKPSFFSHDTNGIFRATSVMACAYTSHYNAPDIFAGLSLHPRPWWSFVLTVCVSFGSAAVLYCVFALAGFMRFGPMLKGNVLLNYETSRSIMFAWVSMLVTLVASFALHVKPARDSLAQVFGFQLYRGTEEVIRVPFVTLSTMVIAAVVLWGVICTDISWILAFRGALLSFPISFVMPGLMLLNCPGGDAGDASFQRIGGWLLVTSGLGNSLLGLYCALL